MTTGLSDFTFGSPFWLWGLLMLPALGGLFLWAESRAKRQLEVLIQNPRLRGQLTVAASVSRRRWRFALLLAGLAGGVLAMAQLQKGYEVRENHRRGLDLILAVDVSKSMLANDIPPDRLQRVKLAIHDLVGQLGGDRLGLVAFAGNAFLQAPLTVDYDAVLDASAELDTELIPLGGTNIGAAIDLALEAFGKIDAGNRAIVLFSDGEPTSDTDQANGVKAAGRAAAAGVKIFTVGMGTTEGSLIPLNSNGTEFVRDQDGKIVRSRLDENNLREIAREGNGYYVRFSTSDATLNAIVSKGLSQMKTSDIDAKTERRPIERYQWPLGMSLIFLGLATAMGERRKTPALPAEARTIRKSTRPEAPALSTVTASSIMGFMVWLTLGIQAARAETAQATPNDEPATMDSSALELYRGGRYDEAYRAFEDLAKKNPAVGGLQFNAGASAYMGKQYDEALDAFGHALTTDNADLRAKSHYNFGNTLFRRGEEQKDREAKIKDWKNAIEHYNSTLGMLKAKNKENPLVGNTAYNRDLVQKRLDEEMKQQPPPPKQQPQKQDQKDQKDQKQPGQQNQKEQQQQGQKNQEQQQGGQKQQNGQSAPQDQSPQQKSSSGKPQEQNSDANQPPKPGDQPSPRDQPPDPSSLPKQDEPRQHGDFQSQAGSSPPPADSPAEPTEEAGKMSPAQARALLDSLKNEDDHVMLGGKPDNSRRHDEPVTKDW